MTKKRKNYTKEFKIETVRLLNTSGKTQAQIEEDLGIGSGCLSRWKQKYAAEGEQAFPGNGHPKPEEEHIRQLERENEILRQERDILKKAKRCLHRRHPSRDQADDLPVHRGSCG